MGAYEDYRKKRNAELAARVAAGEKLCHMCRGLGYLGFLNNGTYDGPCGCDDGFEKKQE